MKMSLFDLKCKICFTFFAEQVKKTNNLILFLPLHATRNRFYENSIRVQKNSYFVHFSQQQQKTVN